jgi:Mor family transcriptional regulator
MQDGKVDISVEIERRIAAKLGRAIAEVTDEIRSELGRAIAEVTDEIRYEFKGQWFYMHGGAAEKSRKKSKSILEDLATGMSHKSIMDKHNVSRTTLYYVMKGRKKRRNVHTFSPSVNWPKTGK